MGEMGWIGGLCIVLKGFSGKKCFWPKKSHFFDIFGQKTTFFLIFGYQKSAVFSVKNTFFSENPFNTMHRLLFHPISPIFMRFDQKRHFFDIFWPKNPTFLLILGYQKSAFFQPKTIFFRKSF